MNDRVNVNGHRVLFIQEKSDRDLTKFLEFALPQRPMKTMCQFQHRDLMCSVRKSLAGFVVCENFKVL